MNIRTTLQRAGLYGGVAFAAALGLLSMAPGIASASTVASSTSNYQVMIMTHLCNPSIQNWNDFENMESGRDPILNIADDVLACPTTGLPGSVPPAGSITGARSTYDFSVASDVQTQTLSQNGTFQPTKVCESDVGYDLNGDGKISTSTCLDISDYMVPITTSSASSTILRVMETQPPAGYHFGTLRFTPVSLDGNNDSEDLAYLNPQTGEIDLNMVPDKDGMIMLHVYQFPNATSTSTMGSTTGSTGSTSTMSSTTPMIPTSVGMIDPVGSVRVGTSADFTGRNFGPEEAVTVMMNGKVVDTAHADGGGNFSTGSLPVPSTPGNYTYLFMGQTSGASANSTVTVTQ